MFYKNYLLIKTKLNNNGANMPKPIQFKTLLLLMLLFSSSTNVFSQTRLDYMDHKWEDERYFDHGNGTVTDTTTALMWRQCAEGLSNSSRGKCSEGSVIKYKYNEAIGRAKADVNKTFAGHTGWRLPNIKELTSLVAYDRSTPTINSTFFPKTPNSWFWSSSPYGYTATNSRSRNFDNADESIKRRDRSECVRLVRDVE
jgi:hypothetical protein